MSAWSKAPYGNDAALDWLNDPSLQIANDYLSVIRSALAKILQASWEGDSDEAQCAIAAAALVAAAAVEPIGSCHKDAKALITKHGFVPDVGLIVDCLGAIKVVCYEERSEIRELWAEEEGLDAWLKQGEKLTANLKAALQTELPTRTQKKQAWPRTLYKLIERYKSEPNQAVRKKIAKKFAAIQDVNRADSDTNFMKPLYLAATHGLFEEAQDLLDRGADPNGDGMAYFGPSSHRPFDAACLSGNLQVADLLRARGAKIFDTVEDRQPNDIDRRVVSVGAKPMQSGDRYWQALINIARAGSIEALEYLLSHGATLHERNFSAEGIVHWAAQGGNAPMLAYLKKAGLDLFSPVGKTGPTPLCKAVDENELEATQFLLENGANPNHVNRIYSKHPETPMDRALTNPRGAAIAKLLKGYGAKTLQELEN
jgi:ankyrin repeat protein